MHNCIYHCKQHYMFSTIIYINVPTFDTESLTGQEYHLPKIEIYWVNLGYDLLNILFFSLFHYDSDNKTSNIIKGTLMRILIVLKILSILSKVRNVKESC